jgi:chaperonin cofactor prefoldin
LNKAKEDIEKKTQKLNDNIKTYAVQHNSNSLRVKNLKNIFYQINKSQNNEKNK